MQSDTVAEESAALLADHNKVFLPSHQRIEISGPEDLNMDYFNDFVLMLETLSRVPSFAVYDFSSQEFV